MDPNTIIVKDRQRKVAEVDEHFIASVRKELLHPIVLRHTDDGPQLVVGGRRLKALIAIGNDLIENKHFRFLENMSETEARIAELEENIKREDLPWRDHVQAIADIHREYKQINGADWTPAKTAQEISTSGRWVNYCLLVFKNLESPLLKDATSIAQAHNILQLAAERRVGQIVNEIVDAGKQIFQTPAPTPDETKNEVPNDPNLEVPIVLDPVPDPVGDGTPGGQDGEPAPIQNGPLPSPSPTPDRGPIEEGNFLDWIKSYSGPKFNVIHVDFPYNVEYKNYAQSIKDLEEDYESVGYWELLAEFVSNLDKFCSYSAHIMFWYSMEFYERTRLELEQAGLFVHKHPLVWFKSDNSGIIPGRDNQYPRRVYETAFLCSRARRPLVRSLANCYAAPLPSNSIHPSQKSEPMLKHFLSMLIDETTDVFDPTSGSGAALKAAEDLGCRRTFGLDINKDYVERANTQILQARVLRRIKL